MGLFIGYIRSRWDISIPLEKENRFLNHVIPVNRIFLTVLDRDMFPSLYLPSFFWFAVSGLRGMNEISSLLNKPGKTGRCFLVWMDGNLTGRK